MPETADDKTCFVVMGFGKKTDFEQQKTFDLDKTYEYIIKPSVEAAGLKCLRADDIIHSGVIDKPMYEQLLLADVVVADLSTSNPNAIYELGVRHALRPRTTIVMAESNFRFPFDVNHLLIRPYEHTGEAIDFGEVERVRADLRTAIETLVTDGDTDSPVYTFLPTLKQPSSGEASADEPAGSPTPAEPAADEHGFSFAMNMFRKAGDAEDWPRAVMALQELMEMRPGDPFIVQQLALATYKGKQPDALTALDDAKVILSDLGPGTSKDPETLGLWGAIHKRLWDGRGHRADLEESVRSYGKGFHLKDDYYNGINYAFMLDVRAAQNTGDDAIADAVWARRVRERVIELCEERLKAPITDDHGDVDKAQEFWVRATLIEALVGTGRTSEADGYRTQAVDEAPKSWMVDSLTEQLDNLNSLLAQQAPTN